MRVFLSVLIFIWSFNCFASESVREYKIKAGFIYNFLFYAQWPPDIVKSPGDTITIGILGDDPFGDVFNIVAGKKIEGKRLEILRLDQDASPEQLRQCRILFICPELEPDVTFILSLIKGYPVLTVSEIEGFGQKGGMINFVMLENKVKFEINRAAAEQEGITLSSRLLRVSITIIKSQEKYEKGN